MKTISTLRLSVRCFIAISIILSTHKAMAANLNLYIQPIASESEITHMFTPLANYLSKQIGMQVDIHTESGFLAYWERMRHVEGFDLALDAAHFTDYRDKHFHYHVVAKFPDTVSFSLVTSQNFLVLDTQDLIDHNIATPASPSLGGVRMAEIFPNPVRQPNLISVENFQLALDELHKGKVQAALVPTPMVRNDPTLNTVLTTKPVPHMAFSVSPKLSAKIRLAIRNALLNASKTTEGRKMLQVLKLPKFAPASNQTYNGYETLLSGTWGY